MAVVHGRFKQLLPQVTSLTALQPLVDLLGDGLPSGGRPVRQELEPPQSHPALSNLMFRVVIFPGGAAARFPDVMASCRVGANGSLAPGTRQLPQGVEGQQGRPTDTPPIFLGLDLFFDQGVDHFPQEHYLQLVLVQQVAPRAPGSISRIKPRV